jgi:hypothetical protein
MLGTGRIFLEHFFGCEMHWKLVGRARKKFQRILHPESDPDGTVLVLILVLVLVLVLPGSSGTSTGAATRTSKY